MTHSHHEAPRLRARIAAVSGSRDGDCVGASDGDGDGRKVVSGKGVDGGRGVVPYIPNTVQGPRWHRCLGNWASGCLGNWAAASDAPKQLMHSLLAYFLNGMFLYGGRRKYG